MSWRAACEADGEAAGAVEPGQGLLGEPAVPAWPFAGVHATAGDAARDGAGPAPAPVAGLVGVERPGRRLRPPSPMAHAGTASRGATSVRPLWRLAGLMRILGGVPSQSATRQRFVRRFVPGWSHQAPPEHAETAGTQRASPARTKATRLAPSENGAQGFRTVPAHPAVTPTTTAPSVMASMMGLQAQGGPAICLRRQDCNGTTVPQAPVKSCLEAPSGAVRRIDRSTPRHEVSRKHGSGPSGCPHTLTVAGVADQAHRGTHARFPAATPEAQRGMLANPDRCGGSRPAVGAVSPPRRARRARVPCADGSPSTSRRSCGSRHRGQRRGGGSPRPSARG